ncbi:hypothetical protein EPI10_002639 [Gossypium australe]|uniref:Uncharacterized protein n=1 Tax=Gossypium australe TaxID=47621 RepID=A0A5B6VEQ0_9ROSI|nr:hypothetical protein EPI10_002639 [Gossypium australe]
MQPNCLFARVMKSKYFPKGDFMNDLTRRLPGGAFGELDAFWKRESDRAWGTGRRLIYGMMPGYQGLETEESTISTLVPNLQKLLI